MTWGKLHIEVDDSGYSFPYLEQYLKPKYYVFFGSLKLMTILTGNIGCKQSTYYPMSGMP